MSAPEVVLARWSCAWLICALGCNAALDKAGPADTGSPPGAVDTPPPDPADTDADTESESDAESDAESDTDTVAATDASDPPEPTETDAALDDTDGPPVFPQHRLVGVAYERFCGPATPCTHARREDGRPQIEQPGSCVAGDQYAPGELGPDVLVCLLDYRRGATPGVIAVLDPQTATWSDPPDGRADFVAAGLLEPPGRSSLSSFLFARLDPSRPDAALIIRSPYGQVMWRDPDGPWRYDAGFDAVWRGAGMRTQSESVVADFDDNGLPDIVQMRCGDDGVCQPVAFYQTAPHTWVASQNFARMPGTSSDAYAWVAFRGDDGWTIAAAGGYTSLGSGSSNLFVQDPSPGADGFPAWTELPGTDALGLAGMSVMLYDLRGVDAAGGSVAAPDGQPELIVSTTVQCPEVLAQLGPSYWVNLTQAHAAWIDQPDRRAPGCWWDPTPATEELAWGIGLVTDDLVLVAQGDDGRAMPNGVGTCAWCPVGGEPMIGYMPYHGRMWGYPPGALTLVNSAGDDISLGNRRTLEVHHVPGRDGVQRTVVVTGGVFDEGWPEVWLLDP